MKYKTIGILGGMGPEATAELYLRIICIFQQEYGAKYDADFPEIVIINLPIPDVVEDTSKMKEIESMLIIGVKKLENAGADFIVIPCNTVTFFLPAMRKSVSVPILSIVQETADEVRRLGIQQIGIIATKMTIDSNLFQSSLQEMQVITLVPDDQRRTTEVIMNILAGKKIEQDRNFLQDLISKLKNAGAEKIILGCTELPLLFKEDKDTIDTIAVLAKAVAREAKLSEETP